MNEAFQVCFDFVLYYGNIAASFIVAAVLFFFHRDENTKHDLIAALSAVGITIASIAQIVAHIKTGSNPSLYELIMNVSLAILFLKGRGNVNKSTVLGITASVSNIDEARQKQHRRYG